MPVEINALESARFGIVAARLTDPTAPLAQVNEAARALAVQMMTVRVDSNELRRVQELEEDGYRLMDTLVYYGRELVNLPEIGISPEGETIRRAIPEDAKIVAKVAREAFAGYYGHYHSDPHLSAASADAAYVEWAESSIARTSARCPALVVEQEGCVVAFLTSNLEIGELVLVGVHPSVQGSGIYGRLIEHGMCLIHEMGGKNVVVSTQINNIAVQKAWGRRGFRMQRSLYTLHKWF